MNFSSRPLAISSLVSDRHVVCIVRLVVKEVKDGEKETGETGETGVDKERLRSDDYT